MPVFDFTGAEFDHPPRKIGVKINSEIYFVGLVSDEY